MGFLRVLQCPPPSACMLGLSPVRTRQRDTGSESGVGPRALHCGCPLLLSDGLQPCGGDSVGEATAEVVGERTGELVPAGAGQTFAALSNLL